MFKHIGEAEITRYFERVHALLAVRGRLFNHAISSPVGEPSMGPRSFFGRYVFPDGELLEVGSVVSAMQRTGLEVRDEESLREHYATTLRHWVKNLERSWDSAVELVGEPRVHIAAVHSCGRRQLPVQDNLGATGTGGQPVSQWGERRGTNPETPA